MIFSQGFRNILVVVCALALLAPTLAEGRNRKGDRLLKLGAQAEANKDYDAALAYYDQAVSADSNEPAYLLADQRLRSRAAESHVIRARKLQKDGQLDQALAEFQKGFLADPSSQVAAQGMRETTVMIRQHAASPGTPILTPAERARQETEKRLSALEGPAVLRPLKSQIEFLSMNNQPVRLLYESAAKLAGINVLFDPAGIESNAGKNFNLDLRNVTLDEALNYIALETHTFWKAISRNAIFVTQEGEAKRAEYQDEVVRVFYVQNASTPQEFTEIFNALRTGSRLTTGLFSVQNQNAIIARGPVDTISLVEKLVHDLDRPKAEVMVDVLVLSVNRTKTSNIGAALLGQGGFTSPLNFTPRSPTNVNTGTTTGTTTGTSTGTTTGTTTGTAAATTGSGLITLAQAGRFSSADYSVTFPSTVVQALLNDATTRIVQRPQVRATDGGKATLLIGSQIPYVSGSLNSAVATPGSIPYATTQFQQVSVGTQIEFAPHVNGPEDISMKIKVDISNVLQRISIAGIDQPVIGKQTDEADIRMKDGEVTILGGLSDKELSNTLSGVPGLTSLPVLNYIFGNRNKTTTDNEILLVLVPHIIRAQDPVLANDLGVYAGSERVVRVNRKLEGGPVNPAAPAMGTPSVLPPAAAGPSPLSPVPGATPGPAVTPGVNQTNPPNNINQGNRPVPPPVQPLPSSPPQVSSRVPTTQEPPPIGGPPSPQQ